MLFRLISCEVSEHEKHQYPIEHRSSMNILEDHEKQRWNISSFWVPGSILQQNQLKASEAELETQDVQLEKEAPGDGHLCILANQSL